MSILYNKKHILYLIGIYFAIFLVELYLYDIRLPIKGLSYFPIKIDLIFIYLTILVFYFEKSYIIIYVAFFTEKAFFITSSCSEYSIPCLNFPTFPITPVNLI